MPVISFGSTQIQVAHGENLRRALLRHGLSPYNGKARWINCRGFGSCGTCAVLIKGQVTDKTAMEHWRLGFPPHKSGSPLRLACQCCVLGDVTVSKCDGFWGHKTP